MRQQVYGSADIIAKSAMARLEQMKSQYGYADMRLVLVKVNNEFKVFFGKIELHYKTDAKLQDIRYDYGNALLVSYILKIDDLLGILKQISEKQPVVQFKDVQLDIGENGDSTLLGSRTGYGFASHLFPMWDVRFNVKAFQINSQIRDLARRGLPAFPDLQVAATHFLKLSSKLDYNSSDRKLLLVMPDFRARIDDAVISGNKVTTRVECREMMYSQLVCKIYMSREKENTIFDSEDLKFDENCIVSCEADFEPEIINVYLLNENNEIIDAVESNLHYLHYHPNVRVETPSLKVIEMVSRGENEEVEFKSRIGDRDAGGNSNKLGDEFLETFASFANTNGGGIILLGVDDHCQIIGTDEDVERLKQRIIHRMPTAISPSDIKFDMERVRIDEAKSVIVIRVYEGNNKPYFMEKKGILIRSGSNDRPITRSELDAIYSKKNIGTNHLPIRF